MEELHNCIIMDGSFLLTSETKKFDLYIFYRTVKKSEKISRASMEEKN